MKNLKEYLLNEDLYADPTYEKEEITWYPGDWTIDSEKDLVDMISNLFANSSIPFRLYAGILNKKVDLELLEKPSFTSKLGKTLVEEYNRLKNDDDYNDWFDSYAEEYAK